jgi:ABC-type nitrate/sulfonate/bicarbonate transport system substrate-binding protein
VLLAHIHALPAAGIETVTVPVPWLNVVIGVVLPAIVALVTKRFADSAVKALLLLFLASVSGVLTQIVSNGGDFDVAPAAMAVLTAFGAAVLAHYGFLKPAGVTGTDGVIARAVPGGVGSDIREELPAASGTPSVPLAQPSRLYQGERDDLDGGGR